MFLKPFANKVLSDIEQQGLYYRTAKSKSFQLELSKIESIEELRIRGQTLLDWGEAMRGLGQPLHINNDFFGEVYLVVDKNNKLTIMK